MGVNYSNVEDNKYAQCTTTHNHLFAKKAIWTVFGPEGGLFQYPTQVMVLGINKQFVDLSGAVLRLCDEYDRLRSLHRFCYNAVEELMHMEDMDFDSKVLNGLRHFIR